MPTATTRPNFDHLSDEELSPKAFHVVSVKRLAKLCDPFACWVEQETPITPEEVMACLARGEEALAETPLYTEINDEEATWTPERVRENHIRKIAYFVRHSPIEPISIDVGMPAFGHTVEHLVDDGNHRLAGQILAGAQTISARIGGQESEAKRLKLWNPTAEEVEICRRQLARFHAEEASDQIPRRKRRP